MTNEQMRLAFNLWYDAFKFRKDYDQHGPTETAFKIWQAATLKATEDEREACAKWLVEVDAPNWAEQIRARGQA